MNQAPTRASWTVQTYDMVPNVTHKICSVFDFPLELNNQHGMCLIPAFNPAKPGPGYTFAEVHRGKDREDKGNFKATDIWCYTAKSMAKDFIGWERDAKDLNVQRRTNLSDMYESRGVFVPEGDVPTEAEIEAAVAKRNEFYARAVDAGDGQFADKGKVSDVDDNAKRGAKMLGIDRNWNKTQDRKISADCPACGTVIKKGIVKCPQCHAILDKKRAIEFGFARPDPLQNSVGAISTKGR